LRCIFNAKGGIYSSEMENSGDFSIEELRPYLMIVKAAIVGLPALLALLDLIRCERMLFSISVMMQQQGID
jgi:hypothetical protein